MQVGVAVLNRRDWEGLSETMTFQQKSEGDEGVGHGNIQGMARK